MLMLIQTAPPVPGGDQLGTALVMSRIMHELAKQVSTTIDQAMSTGNPPILAVVFKLAVIFIVITFFIEVFKVGFKIIASGGTFWANIAEPELVKKAMRAVLCIVFGLGAWVLVKPQPDTGPPNPADAVPVKSVPFITSDANATAQAGKNALEGVFKFLGPDAKIQMVSDALDTLAGKVNAYSLVSAAQESAVKTRMAAAADQAWKEMMSKQGLQPGDAGYEGAPTNGPAAGAEASDTAYASIWKYFLAGAQQIAMLAMGLGVRILYLIMYAAMDVMVVRMLWVNVIFMLIGYKVAWGIIPTLIVLAYFDGLRYMLVNTVRLIFVYAIALTIIAEGSKVIFQDTTVVQDIVQKVETDYINQNKADADAVAFAKLQLGRFFAANANGTKADFMTFVETAAGGLTGQMYGNIRSVLIAPVAVFMALMLVLTLLGKMATVINDALNGTMSFHQR